MILDHGCDAVSCCTIALSVTRALGVEKFWQAVVLCYCAFLFFMANLEQYYTHYLYLPKINAVSEGVWGMALLCIFSGIIGCDFWKKTPLGFENNKILLIVFLGVSIVTTFYHVKKILEKTDSMDLFLRCRMSLLFCLACILFYLVNWNCYDYAIMYVAAFNISKITVLCQLAHVTNRDFQPLRFVNIALLFWAFLILVLSIFSSDVNSNKWILFLFALADFCNFAVTISRRMAKLLGISIFSVTNSGSAGGNSSQTGSSPDINIEGENFKKVQNQHDSMPEDTV